MSKFVRINDEKLLKVAQNVDPNQNAVQKILNPPPDTSYQIPNKPAPYDATGGLGLFQQQAPKLGPYLPAATPQPTNPVNLPKLGPPNPAAAPVQGPMLGMGQDYFKAAGLDANQYTGTAEQNEKLRRVLDPSNNSKTFYDAYSKLFHGWNQHPEARKNNLSGKRNYATQGPNQPTQGPNQPTQTANQVPLTPLDKTLAGYTGAIGNIQKMAHAADAYQMTPVVNNYAQAATDFIATASRELSKIDSTSAQKIMGIISEFRTVRVKDINPKIGGVTTWWSGGNMGEQLETIEQQFRQLEAQINSTLIGSSYNKPPLPFTPQAPGQ
jgi:hypothetical protein